MPAYVIADIEVHDAASFEEYRKQAGPCAAEFGGRYLVRGGALEALEGTWSPRRLVVLEFPSLEKAKAWWNSDSYAGAKAIRQASAHSKFVVVEGL